MTEMNCRECVLSAELIKRMRGVILPFVGDEARLQAVVDEKFDEALENLASARRTGCEVEHIYIPSETDFWSLVSKLDAVRRDHGYDGSEEFVWDELWKDMSEKFAGFGLKDEPQLIAMLIGPDEDGLFFTNNDANTQITLSDEFMAQNLGVIPLSPAAYVCCNIARAARREVLLDKPTYTRFLQYGWFDVPGDGQCVPDAYLSDNGRLEFCGSFGAADSVTGVRFAVS